MRGTLGYGEQIGKNDPTLPLAYPEKSSRIKDFEPTFFTKQEISL